MKTIEELAKIALDDDTLCVSDFDSSRLLVEDGGALFPIELRDGEWVLNNPLDPIEIIKAAPRYGSVLKYVERVVKAALAATQIRKDGFDVLKRTFYGAPKAIDTNDRIIILSEFAKEKKLSFVHLSTQLSDEEWIQSKIPAWEEWGFRNPRQFDWVFDGDSVSIIGAGLKIKLKDGIFSFIDKGLPEIASATTKSALESQEIIRATPKRVWEDKYEDED